MTAMDDDAPTSRRARLQSVRRGRRLQAAVLAMVVVAGGATAYAVGRERDPSAALGRPAPAARTSTTLGSAGAGGATSTAPRTSRSPRRTITNADPLRVWVGGDSLAGELGPSLGALLGPTGVVKVTVDFKVGSGLNDAGVRNWPERVAAQMAATNPDVAIFMIGANDAPIVGGDAARWAPAYRAKVDRLMNDLAGARNRRVLWIGPPTLRDSSLDRGAKALSDLMRQEAAPRRNVTFLDAYRMFSAPGGGYTDRIDLSALARAPAFGAEVTSTSLANVLVRIGDGVHFSTNGATWIAYNVARLLEAEWKIVAQSGGTPISVTIESGGGSIPGYTPHPSRWRPPTTTVPDHGASGTTAPATTAPATTAPTATAPRTTAPATTVPPATSPPTTGPPTTAGGG